MVHAEQIDESGEKDDCLPESLSPERKDYFEGEGYLQGESAGESEGEESEEGELEDYPSGDED